MYRILDAFLFKLDRRERSHFVYPVMVLTVLFSWTLFSTRQSDWVLLLLII